LAQPSGCVGARYLGIQGEQDRVGDDRVCLYRPVVIFVALFLMSIGYIM